MTVRQLRQLLAQLPAHAQEWPAVVIHDGDDDEVTTLLLFPPGFPPPAYPDGAVRLASFANLANVPPSIGIYRPGNRTGD